MSDAYASINDVNAARKARHYRKSGGILKQNSDDSDASEATLMSSACAGRESPSSTTSSKKRVTFSRPVLEKEKQKELQEKRDERRKADIASYVQRLKESTHARKMTHSTSVDSGISRADVTGTAAGAE